MDESSINLLINVTEAFYKPRREIDARSDGINEQRRMGLRKASVSGYAISDRSCQILLNLIDRKKLYPFFALRVVGGDLRIKLRPGYDRA